jgi:hypothetical protein
MAAKPLPASNSRMRTSASPALILLGLKKLSSAIPSRRGDVGVEARAGRRIDCHPGDQKDHEALENWPAHR